MEKRPDILFVNPPGPSSSKLGFPFGISILASILKKNNFAVSVIDVNAKAMSSTDVVKQIEERKPGIVGLTGLWINFLFQREVSLLLKEKMPLIKQLAGGWWASPVPRIVLKETSVDIVVESEADLIISELCHNLLEDKIPDLPGVCYFDKEMKYCASASPILPNKLDTLPTPAYELFDMDYYTEKINIDQRHIHAPFGNKSNWIQATMYSGRGCYGKCHFCGAAGLRRRNHSPEYLVNHMEQVHKDFGVDFFFFNESLSLSTRNWTKSFCRELISRKLNFLYAVECRGDFNYDEETIALLAESGCHKIVIGFESGDNGMLQKMGKGKSISTEKYYEIIRDFRKHKIQVFGSFVLNMPGETKQSLQNTIDFIKKSRVPGACGFASPNPGTELYDYCKRNNIIDDEHTLILENPARDKGRKKFDDYYRVFNYNNLPKQLLIHSQRELDKIGLINNYYHSYRWLYWILISMPFLFSSANVLLRIRRKMKK